MAHRALLAVCLTTAASIVATGTPITVVAVQQPPFVTIDWSSAVPDAKTGLLRIAPPTGILSTLLNKTLTLTTAAGFPLEPTYVSDRNITYDAAIRLIKENRSQIGLGAFTATWGRYKSVAYAPPYVATSLSMVAPIEDGEGHVDIWLFLKPFSLGAWLLFLGAFVVSSCSWWVIDRSSPFGTRKAVQQRHHRREGKVSTVVFKNVLASLEKEVELPTATSTRCATLALFFMVLLVTSAYEAGLNSYELASALDSKGLASFSDLKRTPAPFGVLAGSSIAALIAASAEPALRRLIPFMRLYKNYNSMLEAIDEGHIAAGLGSTQLLAYAISQQRPCADLGIAGAPITSVLWALPYSQSMGEAPIGRAFDSATSALVSAGVVANLMRQQYLPALAAGCPVFVSSADGGSSQVSGLGTETGSAPSGVAVRLEDLREYGGQFIVFTGMLCLSGLVFAAEMCIHRKHTHPSKVLRALNIALGHEYPKGEHEPDDHHHHHDAHHGLHSQTSGQGHGHGHAPLHGASYEGHGATAAAGVLLNSQGTHSAAAAHGAQPTQYSAAHPYDGKSFFLPPAEAGAPGASEVAGPDDGRPPVSPALSLQPLSTSPSSTGGAADANDVAIGLAASPDDAAVGLAGSPLQHTRRASGIALAAAASMRAPHPAVAL